MSALPVIRSVTRADLSGLRALIDAAGLFPSEMLDDMVAGYLDGEGGDETWLTQEQDGQIRSIAYYTSEPMTDGTWNVLLIAVHPVAQQTGLGRALMQHVEADLRARGQRVLIVETSGLEAFAAARRFYLRLGYEEEACIREFYAAGEDKIVFRTDLTRAA